MRNDLSLNFSLLFIPLWVWTLTARSLGFLTAVWLHGSLSPRWPSIQTANWPLGVPVICSRTFCYIKPNHSGGSESLRTVLFAFFPPVFRGVRGILEGKRKAHRQKQATPTLACVSTQTYHRVFWQALGEVVVIFWAIGFPCPLSGDEHRLDAKC